MLKKILLGIAGLIALVVVAVLVVAATSDADKSMSRSISIDAPIDAVFSQVNDLEKWNKWSPWKQMDPAMTVTYGPARSGKDAWYSWSGPEVGEGKLTITKSTAPTALKTSVDFGEMGMGSGSWTFQQDGDLVTATWGFTSHGRHLMDKVFHLFLEGMLGPQLEQGLQNLKMAAEGAPAVTAPVTNLPTAATGN